jgi:hypothetical protein
MQGVDLGKIRGGRQKQQELSQAIAMESASRVMTRKALDMLKSIAMGEYKSVEERQAEAAKKEEESVSDEGEPENAPGEEKAS